MQFDSTLKEVVLGIRAEGFEKFMTVFKNVDKAFAPMREKAYQTGVAVKQLANNIKEVSRQQNMAGLKVQFDSLKKSLQPLKQTVGDAMQEGIIKPSLSAEQAVQGLLNKQKGLSEWSKQYSERLQSNNTALKTFRSSLYGVAKGAQELTMELLGVMFFGMMLQKTFMGLLRPAMELFGVFDLWGIMLQVLFLPIMEELFPYFLSLIQFFIDLDDGTKKIIGAFTLFGLVLGTILMVTGQLGLGIFSLIRAVGWLGITLTGGTIATWGLVLLGIVAILVIIIKYHREIRRGLLNIGLLAVSVFHTFLSYYLKFARLMDKITFGGGWGKIADEIDLMMNRTGGAMSTMQEQWEQLTAEIEEEERKKQSGLTDSLNVFEGLNKDMEKSHDELVNQIESGDMHTLETKFKVYAGMENIQKESYEEQLAATIKYVEETNKELSKIKSRMGSEAISGYSESKTHPLRTEAGAIASLANYANQKLDSEKDRKVEINSTFNVNDGSDYTRMADEVSNKIAEKLYSYASPTTY